MTQESVPMGRPADTAGAAGRAPDAVRPPRDRCALTHPTSP